MNVFFKYYLKAIENLNRKIEYEYQRQTEFQI